MKTSLLLTASLASALAVGSHAQLATSLVTTDDTYLLGSGLTAVTGLDDFNVNGLGGYAILVNNGGSSASGTEFIVGSVLPTPGAVLVQEGTNAGFNINDFTIAPDIADAGAVAYWGRATDGTDVIVGGGTAVAVEEGAISAPGVSGFYRIPNRPTITADGSTVHFINQVANNTGNVLGNALFTGNGSAAPLVFLSAGGSTTTPLGPLLGNVDSSYEFSPDGGRFVNVVDISGNALQDGAIILGSGGALTVATANGGELREGTVVPVASGGNGSLAWDSFNNLGIADDGTYLVTGSLDSGGGSLDFLAINGAIELLQGESLAASGTLTDVGSAAELNNSGDYVAVVGLDNGSGAVRSLVANGEVILTLGDIVNYDGTLTALTDISIGADQLGLTDATAPGVFDVYFKGSTALGDALFVVAVPEPASALTLLAVGGLAVRRRRHARGA